MATLGHAQSPAGNGYTAPRMGARSTDDATIPAGMPPAEPPRGTRPVAHLTSAMLVVCAVLAAWAVGLVALTAIGIIQPAYSLSGQGATWKALAASVLGMLTVLQVWSMETARGHLPRGGLRVRTLMRAHRRGGRVAVGIAAVVAFFCMVVVGAPDEPARVAIHVVFAAVAFAALAAKFALIRYRPGLAGTIAPWLGRGAALALIVVWMSSALAYLTGNL
jgi:hypothetical protein